MLAAIIYDTDFAENVEANQYVAWLIFCTEMARYERQSLEMFWREGED